MARPTLKIIRAIKNSSANEEEMLAQIEAFDKRPQEPLAALVDAIIPKRRGRPPKSSYQTRDMTAEA